MKSSLTSFTQPIIIREKTGEDFSKLLLGILCEEISLKKKVAIIDGNGSCKKLFQLLEHFSLIKEFTRQLPRFYIYTYTLKSEYISKGILPLVEYQQLSYTHFYKELEHFDTILFVYPNTDLLNSLSSFFSNNQLVCAVLPLSDKISFPHTQISYDQSRVSSLVSKNNLNLLTPNSLGSLYAMGMIFSSISLKHKVNYISFENESYLPFLNALKHLPSFPRYYGSLDYVIFSPSNKKEIQEAEKIIETASRKQELLLINSFDSLVQQGFNRDINSNGPLYIVSQDYSQKNIFSKKFIFSLLSK